MDARIRGCICAVIMCREISRKASIVVRDEWPEIRKMFSCPLAFGLAFDISRHIE